MGNEILTLVLEQAFGVVALICTVVSMQLKKKRPLMVLQTMSEVFIVLQYWVKGAFTGSAMSVVAFVRDVVFMRYEKKRPPVWVLLVIYAVMTGLTVLSWGGWLSLLPFAGSLIYAFTLWHGQVRWIKFGNAVGNTPYLVYTLLTGNYVLFAMTAFEVVSAWVGFFREKAKA